MSKSGGKSWHIVCTCPAFFVIFCKKRNLGFVKGHMAGLHVRSAFSSLVGGVGSLYIATRGYKDPVHQTYPPIPKLTGDPEEQVQYDHDTAHAMEILEDYFTGVP